VQCQPDRARHRQLSTGEMHPPTQDRHRVENYRRLSPTPTTDTQQKQRCKRATTPSRRLALTDAARTHSTMTRGFTQPCQLRPYRWATASAASTQASMKRPSST
jgi:hypothetical protein